MVVMGHVLTMCVRGIDSALTFRIVQNVHMPLFFFISGWWAWRPTEHSLDMKKIGSRSARLLIPMVTVSSIWLLYWPHTGLESPLPRTFDALWLDGWKGGYWFTLVLFVIFVVYWLNYRAFRAMQSATMQAILFLGVWLVMLFVKDLMPAWLADILSWQLVCHFYPVFMIGVLARRHSDTFTTMYQGAHKGAWLTAAILVLVASFMVVGWYWEYPKPLVVICRVLLHASLAFVAIAAVRPWSEGGSAPHACAMWAYLGRNSLAIYLLHYFLLFPMGIFRPWLLRLDLAFVPVTLFAAAWAAAIIAGTLVLNYIISFSRPLSYILTGKR